MTALLMEGFESVIDTPDLTNRGWKMSSMASSNGANTMTLPSRTGMPGRGLFLRGPYNSNTTNLPFANAVDFGMLDTGASIYSLWQSGGFCLGVNAVFNKANMVQIANYMTRQIVYDGAQYYWALGQDNSNVWRVYYSTDLQNWTQTTITPGSAALGSSITVIGSGPSATVIVGGFLISTTAAFYYSTNMGLAWTASNATGISGSKTVIATGNVNTPIMFGAQPSSGANGVFYLSSVSGAPVQVAGLALTASSTYNSGNSKLVNGIACFIASSGTTSPAALTTNASIVACCPVSKDMTIAANYTLTPSLAHQLADITFLNNTWIAVGHGGIYTSPNSGTVGAPAGPTAAWSTALAVTQNGGVYSIDTNGTVAVAVGNDNVSSVIPAIYTSTDGVSWAKQNRLTFTTANNVANTQPFTNVFWDGHQFVLTGGVSNSVVATSPDGFQWTPQYVPDYTESSGGSVASMLGVYSGVMNAGAWVGASQAAGGFAPWTTGAAAQCGVGLLAGPVSNGARNVSAWLVPGGTTTSAIVAISSMSAAVPTNPLSHYYELIATATASVNTFTFQLAIDGVVQPALSPPVQFAATGDTTGASHLIFNLPRSGNWVMVDDLYLTNFSGSNNVGQLGVTSVLPWVPSSDVQAQYNRTAGSSNASQVVGPLSNAQTSVNAQAVGAKDIYGMTTSVPVGYRVRAMQAEAYFSKFGATGAAATVGIVSNGAESDSAQANAATSTPVYASVLCDTDPKTGAAWTVAAAQAAEIAIVKAT
jgi:hypothetical protein